VRVWTKVIRLMISYVLNEVLGHITVLPVGFRVPLVFDIAGS